MKNTATKIHKFSFTMLKKLFFSTLMGFSPFFLSANGYTDLVNPLMGTLSSFELSTGNTYPAIALPWGMNFWSPRTAAMSNAWHYSYDQNKIYGFKQTHQPSPWINDYGQFSLMPVTGKHIEMDENKRASWFSHKSEIAKPYYYKVYLADYDVTTELVPTERAAMFRFTFPENDSYVVVDAFDRNSRIKILPEQKRIIGYTTRNGGGVPENFKNYFIIEFDKPFNYTATFSNDETPTQRNAPVKLTLKPGQLEQSSYHTGGVVGFKTQRGEQVHARVASSFISDQQALLNLDELGNLSFDELKAQSKQKWEEVLSRIEVEGGHEAQYKTFYSCLYRSLLFPRRLYEINAQGQPVHYSPYNGKVLPGYMYTDTGFWDTFRSLFPLLNLLYPSENLKMQEGLLNAYRESGFFPEWASPGHRQCMVGNNSASVLVDAFMKDVKVKDVETLYEGLIHGTTHCHPHSKSTGRLGHEYFNSLGYVPCDVGINENAARSLEYAYDDWCILQLARKLNRPQQEIAQLSHRAMNYKNLFNPDYNLMCGRNKDGSFEKKFSPMKWGGNFTEGNSWHYTWSVFHDPQGLINLMGGKATFISQLDSVFKLPPVYDDSYYGRPIHEIIEMTIMNMGNYAHGNQPIQHMIYLYNYAGAPWKAQYWLRKVMNTLYTPTPDGYCGDEDNGQTSSWYVFSALGFYPVCPGSDQYVMGSPLFKKAVLHQENGRDIILSAPNNEDETVYIKRMEMNGKKYTKNYISFKELREGAHFEIEMSEKPNKKRGIQSDDLPYSFSNENSKH